MSARLTIALDAMGGDNAPAIVVNGADLARVRHPEVEYVLFGDQAKLTPLLDRLPKDRKSTRLNSSHSQQSRMPSSA